MTGVFGSVVQCVFVFSCVQLVLWLSYLVCTEMRYSIILFLSVCYINCYKDITPKRHKGLCQISLNGTDSKEYNFDLSSIQAKYLTTKYYGGVDFFTYLSICEFYVDNRINYNNPCETGSMVCFLNGSKSIAGDRINEFDHKFIAVKYDETKYQLNVTFSGYRRDRSSNVTIMFFCSKIEYDPEFIVNVGLEYYYKWTTPSACPVNDLEIRNACIFQPKDEEYIYDLRDLRNETYYVVTDNDTGTKYSVNVCGTIEEHACMSSSSSSSSSSSTPSNVVVCNDTSPEVFVPTADLYTLDVYEKGIHIVAPPHKRGRRFKKMFVDVICDELATKPYNIIPQPGFKFDKTDFGFEIRSPLSCVPPYYRCSIRNNVQQYDVRALRKTRSNYVVESNRQSEPHFILNVCGYLNNNDAVSDVDRDRKLYAYVVYDDGRREIYDQFIKLQMDDVPGSLQITYISSENVCNNDDKKPWKILIQLRCPKTNKLARDLQFNNSDPENCIHTLTWHTEYACPVMLYHNHEEDCTVDESYDETFTPYNFSSRNLKSNVIVKSGQNESYHLSICGPLNGSCNGDTSAAVCWNKGNGSEVVIGRDSSTPFSRQGEKYFDMIGDACYKGGPLSRVMLYMKCSRALRDSSPRLVEVVKEECLFIFEWYVVSGCPASSPVKNCNFAGYNLTRLSAETHDYFVYINETAYFVLNACHSLLRGKNVLCNTDALSCIVNLFDDNFEYRSETISTVNKFREVDNRTVSVLNKCDNNYLNDVPSTNYTFKCSPYLVNPLITFERHEDEDNTYFFDWKTRYGCSDNKTRDIERKSYEANCSFVDSTREHRYNLSKLNNTVWNVTSGTTGNIYNFVICGEYRFKNCTVNNGVCVKKQNGRYESGGELSSRELKVVDDTLITATYVGGDSCSEEGKSTQRTTVIKLICSYSSELKLFIADELDNCRVNLVFMLSDSCPDQSKITCSDYNIRTDQGLLSEILPSIKTAIRTDDGYLVFNLCNPEKQLTNESLLNNVGSNGQTTNNDRYERSYNTDNKILGFQTPYTHIRNNMLIINFVEGSACTLDSTPVASSAQVFLMCNFNSTLLPVLDSKQNCVYIFYWSLAKLCNKSKLTLLTEENRCLLKNEETGHETDLKSLLKMRYTIYDDSRNTYTIDLCGASSSVPKTQLRKHVGFKTIFYGSPMFASIEEKHTVLFFDQGEPCDQYSNYYAEIRLICGTGEKLQPKVIEYTSCSVLIEFPVVSICPPSTTTQATDTDVSPRTDTSFVGGEYTITIGGIVVVFIVVAIVLSVYFKCHRTIYSSVGYYRRIRGYQTPPNIVNLSVNSMEGSELSEISSIMGASTIHNRRNPRNLQSIFKMGKNIE